MAAKRAAGRKLKATPKQTSKRSFSLSPYKFHFIMAAVAVAILVGGYLFYYFQEQQMRQRIEGGLSVVAELKAEQIEEWRNGRLADADILVGSPFFVEGVQAYLDSPTDTEARDKVIARLAIIQRVYTYQDILLTDTEGTVILNLNDSVKRLSDVTRAQLAVAINERKAVIADFHYPPDSTSPHLDVIAPLFPWGQDSPPAVGAVIFSIDPSTYLYPLLQSSPTPSRSGETLLVERDGDEVLYLNELRSREDAALKLRIPLTQQDVPAVMAVLGWEGIVQGKDYRGVPVLAALKQIPDSPWYMVSKIDTSEALSAWRARSGMIIAFFGGLLAAGLATIGLVWQRRQRRVYEALYRAEVETQALRSHFDYLVKYANDIILLVDADLNIVEANDRALETYGYTRQEMLGIPTTSVIPPGDIHSFQARLRKIQQKGEMIAEAIHQRKDGSTFPVEVSSRQIKIGRKTYIQAIIRDITERKQAEAEIKLNEARLKSLLDISQLKAKDSKALLDFALNEAIKLTRSKIGWFGFFSEETRTLTVITWSQNVMKECQTAEETRVFHLDNGGIWAEGIKHKKPFMINDYPSPQPNKKGYPEGHVELSRFLTIPFLSGGQVVAAVAVANKEQDYNDLDVRQLELMMRSVLEITKLKQAEQALQQSEEKYRLLVESSPDIVWTFSDKRGTLFASSGVESILGYTPDYLYKNPWLWNKSIHPEDQPLVNQAIKSFAGGKDVDVEYRIKNSEGDWLWFNDRSIGREETEDEVIIKGISRNITERKRMEQALRQSEERYRTILEGMDDSYYEVDLAGNFTFANDSLCRRLGHSREELIGMNYRAYTPKDKTDATFKIFNQVYRSGQPIKGASAVAVARAGSLIFTERSVFPLQNEEGKIIGFRGISRDVTQRILAEEERKQLELKAQISSRLASVGEMAAGVAHEINNPLTGITGYAQLLMERNDLQADIKSDLAAINDGAQRVAGIVQRLLAFSRQTKPQRKLVDINDLIESTLILRAYHLRVSNIDVVSRLAPGFLETVVDPGQIQQVLLNLIVNAEMEMKLAHGKGKLTITTEKTNNTIKVSVKDNGPGIKPEIIDRIFDPFFTTRDVGQGTGLGLSLCYGIIAEHSGKIYARSQPGKGATFIVELPVVTAVPPPEPAKPAISKPRKKTKASILVVDDEAVVRDIAKRVLSAEGHRVDATGNALEALGKIKNKKYDLILLDVKMPGMNGIDMYKRIQRTARPLASKVVFMTGDIMGVDTEKFLTRTGAKHIEKPFDAEQLTKAVTAALDNSSD